MGGGFACFKWEWGARQGREALPTIVGHNHCMGPGSPACKIKSAAVCAHLACRSQV